MPKLIDRFNAMVAGDAPGSAVGRLISFRPTSIEVGKAIFELEAGPQLVECDVTDDEGRLVARAMSTCMTLRGEMGEGR